MKKLVTLGLLVILLLLGAWAAGPFWAVHNIRNAIQAQDTAALSEHIDFPALRVSFKQQLDDQLARRAGTDAQSSVLGAIALQMAGGLTEGIVDLLATPAGLGALIEGRAMMHRVTGGGVDPDDPYVHSPPGDPLEGAKYAFESPSRFTITLHPQAESPLVVVMTRTGLRWRVTEVRLPLGPADSDTP